jgi:hypothetical protein
VREQRCLSTDQFNPRALGHTGTEKEIKKYLPPVNWRWVQEGDWDHSQVAYTRPSPISGSRAGSWLLAASIWLAPATRMQAALMITQALRRHTSVPCIPGTHISAMYTSGTHQCHVYQGHTSVPCIPGTHISAMYTRDTHQCHVYQRHTSVPCIPAAHISDMYTRDTRRHATMQAAHPGRAAALPAAAPPAPKPPGNMALMRS